jgi:hypothetical protein
MRRAAAALVIATACAIPLTAFAGSAADGNDWLSRCDGATVAADTVQATYCFSYARGLADGLSIWAIVSPTTAPACIPTETQGQQLLDVGMAFLKQHPDMQHLAAGIVLTYSFVEAWPCSAARPSSLAPTR